MNDRRPLIVTGLVLLLIIALIGGVIFYLVNFIRSRQDTGEATSNIFPTTSANIVIANPSPSVYPVASTTPNQTAQTPTTGINGNSKFINTGSFQLSFPNSWGVLSCSNSKNFELDPYNSTDSTVTCSHATKPVTVLVGR